MKKIILIIIIALLYSCSSDDSTEQNIEVNLSGNWFFGKTVYFYNDGSEETEHPSNCDIISKYNITPENDINIISYILINGSCQLEEVSNLEYFKLSLISDNNYMLIVKETNTPETHKNIIVNFENNNAVMTWKYTEPNPVYLIEKINYFTR